MEEQRDMMEGILVIATGSACGCNALTLASSSSCVRILASRRRALASADVAYSLST